jgi:hypothetical protein
MTFLSSNQKIIAKPNHDFFKVKSPLGLEREFLEKSNRAMREIISKTKHVLFF